MYDELSHHGILGQKWGVRRYQNPDGTLTAEGKKHYSSGSDVKKNLKRTAAAALTTAGLIKASNAAALTGIGLARDLQLGKIGYPAIKALRTLASAADTGRVVNNVAHMAGMLAGKTAFGEALMAGEATAKAAAFGAKTTFDLLGSYGNAKLLEASLITAANVTAGAAIAGMVLTGVSAGVTAYSVGKAIKKHVDKKRQEKEIGR